MQLGTTRFLNCLLGDPEDVPAAVVDYVAEQLGPQPADLKGYGEKARWAPAPAPGPGEPCGIQRGRRYGPRDLCS
ncbi:DUF4158 domain-containing protein [Nonomuraea sp. NPDC052265]|uniref:DUF4158 domain-containing protein n=1 Tax=Nonomuraea sp. NPDC052265 TaxID=3364374 RepID=UPI0037C5C805